MIASATASKLNSCVITGGEAREKMGLPRVMGYDATQRAALDMAIRRTCLFHQIESMARTAESGTRRFEHAYDRSLAAIRREFARIMSMAVI